MNAPFPTPDTIAIPQEFSACFGAQRAAYLEAPEPTHAERIADLKASARLLKDNREELVAAINADYGHRSSSRPCSSEYFVVLDGIRRRQQRRKNG